MRLALLAVPLLLAACAEPDDQPNPPPLVIKTAQPGDEVLPEEWPFATDTPALGFDGRGLLIGTVPRTITVIPFGARQAQVETTVGRLPARISAEHSRNEECGAGPIDFARFGGLTLNFQNGEFVGWLAQEGILVNSSGPVSPGITRAELEKLGKVAIIADSTLEGEFEYAGSDGGAIGGFFDGSGKDARVTALYAGINCFFR